MTATALRPTMEVEAFFTQRIWAEQGGIALELERDTASNPRLEPQTSLLLGGDAFCVVELRGPGNGDFDKAGLRFASSNPAQQLIALRNLRVVLDETIQRAQREGVLPSTQPERLGVRRGVQDAV